MSLSRPIQWYHSHADPIRPDGIFKITQPCKKEYAELCGCLSPCFSWAESAQRLTKCRETQHD